MFFGANVPGEKKHQLNTVDGVRDDLKKFFVNN